MENSLHTRESQDKHWQGKYFGPCGVIAEQREKYNTANIAYTVCLYEETPSGNLEMLHSEMLRAAMSYTSTLFSSVTHAIKQVMKGRLKYVSLGYVAYKDMAKLVEEITDTRLLRPNVDRLSPSEQEVLMAVLMFKGIVTFHNHWNQAQAIMIGQKVLDNDNAPAASVLLVKARLSTFWFWSEISYEERSAHRVDISLAIYDEHVQKSLGWKTINRLARLIGDKKMKHFSAQQDGSPDIMLKSGI